MADEIHSLPEYSYKALSSIESLRVLRLRPARNHNDAIYCELLETCIDESYASLHLDQYEAVSWCWGALEKDRRVRILDGEKASSLFVSPNLEAALKILRLEDRTRNLWVDAICIDQNNIPERNQQVARMHLVYGRAKNICIWLGAEDETSHRAINFVKTRLLSFKDFDAMCEDPALSQDWQALEMLMSRPWFSRRWVLQEVALARHALLYCGKDSIPWIDFADAISLFVEASSHKQTQSILQNSEPYESSSGLAAALLVDATSNIFPSSGRKREESLLSLEYIVCRYSAFKVTELRDAIYALLALAQDTVRVDTTQHLPEVFQRLSSASQEGLLSWLRTQRLKSQPYRVDYDAPLAEVYKTFIAFCISRAAPETALDIICRPWAPRIVSQQKNPTSTKVDDTSASTITPTARSSQTPSLPSWISDLSRAAFPFQIHRYNSQYEQHGRQNADPLVSMPGTDRRNYAAAGTKPVRLDTLKWVDSGQYYSMFVEGFVLDQIVELEDAAWAGNIPPTWFELAGWYNTDEDPPDEFWRTLVADRDSQGRNPQSFYPRACKQTMGGRSMHRGSLMTKELMDHNDSVIITEFLTRVRAVIWDRRLARTRGDRLALVDQTAQKGDHICVFFGCSVPIVVRMHHKDLRELRREGDEEVARQKQKERFLAKKVLDRLRLLRKRNAQKVQMTDWSLLRFTLALTVIASTEYHLELNVRQAAYVNSLPVLWPHLLAPIKPTLNPRTWQRIRRWSFVVRTICLALLAIDMGSSTYQLLICHLRLFSIACVLALVSYFHISNRDWLHDPYLRPHRFRHLRDRYLGFKFYRLDDPDWHPLPATLPGEKHCELIGECYVDGMMSGEAITYQAEREIRSQRFEIR